MDREVGRVDDAPGVAERAALGVGRCRRSVKARRDRARFTEVQRVLPSFQAKEMAGEIGVFFGRKRFPCGFVRALRVATAGRNAGLAGECTGPCERHRLDEPAGDGVFPSDLCHRNSGDGGRSHGRLHPVAPSRQIDRGGVDNAQIHNKAVRDGQWDWLLGRVWVLFLPSYAPELNLIEVL